MNIFNQKFIYTYLPELASVAIADGKIDVTKATTVINTIAIRHGEPILHFNHSAQLMLRNLIQFFVNAATLNRIFSLQEQKKLALICGAGISGLCTALELIANGYRVIIAEKRTEFTRFNLINLDVEVQRFLKDHKLLEKFEQRVAGRIKFHKYLLFTKGGIKDLDIEDVSKLKATGVPFIPEAFDKLFTEGGIYSVKIKDLQNFLLEEAINAGAYIFGNVTTEVLVRSKDGGTSKTQIRGYNNYMEPIVVEPNLQFIAEGAKSSTPEDLGMARQEIPSACSGENWIFGNTRYNGRETYVISVIDVATSKLKVANLIFNAKVGEINIALTSDANIQRSSIESNILKMLHKVLTYAKIPENPQSLLTAVNQPVHIKNIKLSKYSIGNIFCIGDSTGHSSPLAGMGGTICMTFTPHSVRQLLSDIKFSPKTLHSKFHITIDTGACKWIHKSHTIKTRCLKFFDNQESCCAEQEANNESEHVSQKHVGGIS